MKRAVVVALALAALAALGCQSGYPSSGQVYVGGDAGAHERLR